MGVRSASFYCSRSDVFLLRFVRTLMNPVGLKLYPAESDLLSTRISGTLARLSRVIVFGDPYDGHVSIMIFITLVWSEKACMPPWTTFW